ncbi:MAG: DUF4783 domain-containing protein [Sphingomonadales bacterium]
MKIQLLSLGFLLPAFFLLTVAATSQDALESVLGALKSGNASQLAGRFEKELTLTLPDQSSQLNKLQAQAAISKFFSANPVTGFELKHRGNAPGGAFAMGTLLTEKGKFRVNVFMSAAGPKEGVRELRIQTMD